MSRTDAHVPDRVEAARAKPLMVKTVHRHWVPRVGFVSCLDPAAGCFEIVTRWASSQPWARKGTMRDPDRARVRDALRLASKQYRGNGEVDDEAPDPHTRWCLCQSCG